MAEEKDMATEKVKPTKKRTPVTPEARAARIERMRARLDMEVRRLAAQKSEELRAVRVEARAAARAHSAAERKLAALEREAEALRKDLPRLVEAAAAAEKRKEAAERKAMSRADAESV